MAQGREASAWGRASIEMSLLWSIFRVNCAKPPKALAPDDFNPYATKFEPSPEARQADQDLAMDAMKALFVAKRKKNR